MKKKGLWEGWETRSVSKGLWETGRPRFSMAPAPSTGLAIYANNLPLYPYLSRSLSTQGGSIFDERRGSIFSER